MSSQEKESVRVMVDMSATLIHNGHTRLLEKAKNCIKDKHVVLVVGLTTDEEVKKHKNYNAELSYSERKEVLDAIVFVDEVVPTPWEITDDVLTKYNIDYLAHGSDNSNEVDNVIVFDRTQGISSHDLRERALRSIVQQRNSLKPIFTIGPSNLSLYNLLDVKNVFETDDEYIAIENIVLQNILKLTKHEKILPINGSVFNAIDIATSNFVTGEVLIVTSGKASDQIIEIYKRKHHQLSNTNITVIPYSKIEEELDNTRPFDWVVTSYVDPDKGFLADINLLYKLKKAKKAKLFLEATTSINLETSHNLADACVFDSSHGLGGTTGLSFITYNCDCLSDTPTCNLSFSLDINSYINKLIPTNYHAICSLYTVSKSFSTIRENIRISKAFFAKKFSKYISKNNQPLISTLVNADTVALKKGVNSKITPNKEKVISHLADRFTTLQEIGSIYDNLIIK